jgi:hypothetical protein
MYIRWLPMLTSMVTGPLALALVRAASVVGTESLLLGFFVVGVAVVGFAVVTGASVEAAVVGDVAGTAVVTGTAVDGGAVVAGAEVVAGAVVVTGAAVVAGTLEGTGGIEGNTNDAAGAEEEGVSWACAISIPPARTEVLTRTTASIELRAHTELRRRNRGEVFTT